MLDIVVPRRFQLSAYLLLAFLSIGQVAIHHHGLASDTSASLSCAGCTAAAPVITTAAPVALSVPPYEHVLTSRDERVTPFAFARSVASRGPPSC
ncbi:MAG TPA: hypothetical protein VJZ00_00045 [Thermoanaerobaculia bacterium]|nr:hypothetical protein [Thermoanaerobaculia bacterium]